MIYLIGGQFFIMLINAAFMLILNIYLSRVSYTDAQIGNFLSYRFLAVLLLAVPLGLWIKGRKLIPVFYAATGLIPVTALVVVFSVEHKLDNLLYVSFFVWGVGFAFGQVCMLPFILRNIKKELHSEAISLSFSMFGLSQFVAGLLIFLMQSTDVSFFTDRNTLLIISGLGFLGPLCVYLADVDEHIPELDGTRFDLSTHDWMSIVKVFVPSMIIAVGAGLTIPFMNLFFHHIFGFTSGQFAIMGSGATVLMFIGILIIPAIKKKFGYHVAITLTQSIAVGVLVLLGGTDFFSDARYAVYVAVICFTVRKPLMNAAGPMTSELAMYYVGEENREIMSAIQAAVWSGSWFVSSQAFRFFRELDVRYGWILMITAGFYVIGVVWYFFLIGEYQEQKEEFSPEEELPAK